MGAMKKDKKPPESEAIPLDSMDLAALIRNGKIYNGEEGSNPDLRRAITNVLAKQAIKGGRFMSGRAKGAVKNTTKYLIDLASRNPDATAKALFKIACNDAESGNSPFTYDRADGGILLDGDTEVNFDRFSKRISKAKNRHMR